MVDVSPFRAWRYDVSQVGALDDVVAPPYDVIDSQFQDALYKQHPCNVIRLILNRPEPGDASNDDRYRRAADFWKHWRVDGILQQDRDDTLYVYHQQFDWEGKTYIRKGFLARLRLAEFGTGQVFPHEQTLSGPKADQLNLMRACHANLSPIFGLFPDSNGDVQNLLDDACLKLTAIETKDHLGVIQRVWTMTDPQVVNRVRELMRPVPVFIADGHHRYETALNYRRELAAAGKVADELAAPNFVLSMFVGMQDPGLIICPTHRLVSGWPGMTSADVRAALGSFCEIQSLGRGDTFAQEAWDSIEADGGQNLFGLCARADGEWLLVRVKDAARMATVAADHSPAWRDLGVSLLHKLLLDDAMAAARPGFKAELKYVHQVKEVTDALAAGACDLACLTPAASIDHVEEIASLGETMPPKSTYFYPKLLSGVVFHSVG